MPVTQFIDGNQFVQSVTSGQRNTFALAELQRSLRDQDRKFIFDTAADPFRLQELQAKVRADTASAQVAEQTVRAQIDTANANASITQDTARFRNETFGIRVEAAQLRGLTNRQNAATNVLTSANNLDAFNLGPDTRTRDQDVSFAAAEASGVDTSKVARVDFNKNAGLRANAAATATSLLDGTFKFTSATPEQDARVGETLVQDIQSGGPVSRALTRGGLTPEAQVGLVQPYVTMAEAASQANTQVGTLAEENRKLQLQAQKYENRILQLERDLIQGAPGQRAPAASSAQPAQFPINTDPLQASLGIQPIDPNTAAPVQQATAPAQPAPAQPAPARQVDPSRPANISRVLQDAPVTPQVVAELLPIDDISDDDLYEVALMPSIVTASGGFQFEGPEEPAVQLGISESDEPVGEERSNGDVGGGRVSLPVVDPRGPTGGIYYAMMTQESRNRQFDSRGRTIVSPSGAVGIGQLLPSTAKETAEKHGIPYSRNKLFNDANYNANLGKLYFDGLIKKYKSTTIAVAAYNMGPGNANNAISQLGDPRRGQISEAEWVRRLPTVRRNGRPLLGLKETREYVKKVYGFYEKRRRGGN